MGSLQLRIVARLSILVGQLHGLVGCDALVVDVLAVGAVPAGGGDFELAAVFEVDQLLHHALAVALLADHVGGFVVVQRAGGDFGGRGAAGVH